MLTRRTFLGAVACRVTAKLTSRPPPNFLFILADDHAGYALGADGNPLAETPNLDRLASEGVRFSRHFCNSPVCSPSRQSFLTGQLPHMAGVTRLPTPLSEDKPTLAKQLRLAGYKTAVFGKMHFNRPAYPGLHGFDVVMTEDVVQREWQAQVKARTVPPGIRTKPPWRPFKDPARIWLNADKLAFPRSNADMKGAYIAHQTVKFLQENNNKTFALWASFHEPHSPFDFPIEDRGRFEPGQFPVPRVGPEDGAQIPLIFRDLSDADKQGIIAAYYTSVHFLDRNVGVVLGELRRLGLEENTLVVYMADHGYSLGQHGRFEKHCGYDPALRVPLLLRWPGRVRQGVVADLTEHVDVPATILDALNVDPLPIMHGRSLRGYLEGKPSGDPHDHIFCEYLENEEAYIRTHRWKFVFCSGQRERKDGYQTDHPTPGRYIRLFDLEADPDEFKNVGSQHPGIVVKMEQLMLDRFRRTHPEAEREPAGVSREARIEWYLRPRDA